MPVLKGDSCKGCQWSLSFCRGPRVEGRSIKIQSFDNQTWKFTRPLGNVLVPLCKHLKRSKVSNGYGHFDFCSFENQNELWEINRGISVGYRLWSLTISRGIKEERAHLNNVRAVSSWRWSSFSPWRPQKPGNKRLVLNMIARLTTPERVKSSLKRQIASTQQLQSPESNLKSPARKKVSTLGWTRQWWGRVSSTENERRFSSDKEASVT